VSPPRAPPQSRSASGDIEGDRRDRRSTTRFEQAVTSAVHMGFFGAVRSVAVRSLAAIACPAIVLCLCGCGGQGHTPEASPSPAPQPVGTTTAPSIPTPVQTPRRPITAHDFLKVALASDWQELSWRQRVVVAGAFLHGTRTGLEAAHAGLTAKLLAADVSRDLVGSPATADERLRNRLVLVAAAARQQA